MYTPHVGLVRGAVAAGVVVAVAGLVPAYAYGQQTDQDSASSLPPRNAVEYQYRVDDGPGRNGDFWIEVKQASPNGQPVVMLNGKQVELDSTGSKQLDLPNGGHITIGRGANGQVTIQDGGSDQVFAVNGDLQREMRQAQEEMAREMRRAQEEVAQAQREMQQFNQSWQPVPDITLPDVPAPAPERCPDSTSKQGVER